MEFNLLIVDDNVVFRMGLASGLKQEGYTVSEAANGEAALQKIQTEKFDLILTDLVLPDSNGMELVKTVRSTDADTRLVILTGYADVSSAIEALRYGADDYIEKEASLDTIINLINNTLVELVERRELAHVQERYKTILDSLNDAIGVVDKNGRISYVSSSITKILGYSPEEMIGRDYLDFVYPADRSSVAFSVQEHNLEGRPYINTNRLVSKKGDVVCVRFSSNPIFNNGELEAIHTVLTDISETKQLQEELVKKESRALAGELAAFVAHDINTPLQGVMSILEHCRAEQKENSDLQEYISLIQSGLLKIKSTVLNLLELENPVISATTDINLYLHKVFHLAESYLKSYGIMIDLHLGPDLPKGLISTKDFEELLLELIREEVWWFGQEEWDVYPAYTVLESGKKIVDEYPGGGEQHLFKQQTWKIESIHEAGNIVVKFHNTERDTGEGGVPCDKFGILDTLIRGNNCTLNVDRLPEKEKVISIGIPAVVEDGENER